jgi:hypothetical protein
MHHGPWTPGAGYFPPPPEPVTPATPPGPVEREVSALDAVRFVFREPNTLANLLFGLLLQLIPVIGPITFLGWLCEVHRRLAWRHPNPIPKFSFDDFSEHVKRGVVPFLGQLALVLAAMIPLFVGMLGGVAVSATLDEDVAVWLLAGAGLLSLPFALALYVIAHSVVTLGELSEDFGTMFSPRNNWDYARAIGFKLLVTLFFLWPLALGVFLGGVLMCGVGVYLSVQVLQFASAHLRWQIYNYYLLEGGAPFTTKPPSVLAAERRPAPWPGVPQPGAWR